MSLMLGKLYEALRAGSIPEEKAREAAEEVAAYDNRLNLVEGDLRLLKWMIGVNIGLTAAVLVKLLA